RKINCTGHYILSIVHFHCAQCPGNDILRIACGTHQREFRSTLTIEELHCAESQWVNRPCAPRHIKVINDEGVIVQIQASSSVTVEPDICRTYFDSSFHLRIRRIGELLSVASRKEMGRGKTILVSRDLLVVSIKRDGSDIHVIGFCGWCLAKL